jgi:hypothetical protein
MSLFAATSEIAALVGQRVELRRSRDVDCPKCKSRIGIIAEGAGPHKAAIHCSFCERFREWMLSHMASTFLETVKVFGRMEPIIIRDISDFASANDAASSGANAASSSSAHIGHRSMVLGFNFSNGGSGGDIVPFVKYDARAGRLFRNDRKEVNGGYTNVPFDITASFKAVMDFENVEVGYIRFAANSAPEHLLVPFGEQQPPRPDNTWKQGMRIMLKLDPGCGGDVREISSNAQAFLKGLDELHTKYEVEKHKNPGKLPVVVLRTAQPITTGAGDKKSTNYQPTFEITGWAPRPADLVFVPKADDGAP